MKKQEIKNKIINNIMKHGKKKVSEAILIKSAKKLQKNSNKQFKKIMQLALINSLPTFKLHKIENKKQKKRNRKIIEIPAFISKPMSRNSNAIKFILYNIEKKKSKKFHVKLNQEILVTAQSQGNAIEMKNTLQKQVLSKRHFFNYYRWK